MYKKPYLSALTRALLLILATTPYSFASTSATPIKGKHPIPLEQIISQIRKQHGALVVQTTRLTEEDKRAVRVIDFVDDKRQRQRAVVDAYTGKELSLAPMKAPLPLEQALEKVKNKHQSAIIMKTWLEQKDDQTIRKVDFIDKNHKRWQASLDAYTGMLIDEYTYSIEPTGKLITLQQVLDKARANHKNMIILKTRLTHRKSSQVREIFYLDDSRHKKKLVVNAITGEVIEDKAYPSLL